MWILPVFPLKGLNNMIYDCIMFNNEWEILEIRLHTLAPVIDKFIIVQGERSFTGNHNELYPDRMEALNKRFSKKIQYDIICPPLNNNPWTNEYRQRNYIGELIREFEPEDLIMLSDCDEIPDTNIIERIKIEFPYKAIIAIEQAMYFYYLNCRHSRRWIGPVIGKRDVFIGERPQFWRDRRGNIDRMENCGWHFSYQGGFRSIINKLRNTAEQQDNTDKNTDPMRLLRLMETGEDIFERDPNFTFISSEAPELPRYVREHSHEFIEKGYLKA